MRRLGQAVYLISAAGYALSAFHIVPRIDDMLDQILVTLAFVVTMLWFVDEAFPGLLKERR